MMESKMHRFMQFSTFLEFDITSLEGRIKVLCVFNRESINESRGVPGLRAAVRNRRGVSQHSGSAGQSG